MTERWRALVIGLVVVVGVGVFARGDGLHDAGTDRFPAAMPDPTSTTAPVPTQGPNGPTPPRATPTGRPPAIDAAVPRVVGRWVTDLPPAPMRTPAHPTGVWTGEDLVVGFEHEVVALDGHTLTWRPLPDHPLGGAHDRQIAWTGSEVLVVGGIPGECGPEFDSCARPGPPFALDPAVGRWRRLPPLPTAVEADMVVARAGDGALVWGPPLGDPQGPPVGARYDTASNRWTSLPPVLADGHDASGLPAGTRIARIAPRGAAWTGDAVMVWGVRHPEPGVATPFAAVYDLIDAAWSLVDFPLLTTDGDAAWAGDALVVFGHASQSGHGWAVSPATGAVDPLPVLGGLDDPRTSVYGGAVAWTGHHVLYLGGHAHAAFLAWSPSLREWTVLNAPGSRVGAVAAWTGAHLLVWGGYTGSGPTVDVAAWVPPPSWTGAARRFPRSSAVPREGARSTSGGR